MVTDTKQTVTVARPSAGVITRAAEQLRQFVCGLHGHDALLHFEQGRMSLQCTSCGHETPGWDLGSSQTSETANTAASQPAVRLPLVRERRAA